MGIFFGEESIQKEKGKGTKDWVIFLVPFKDAVGSMAT